MLPIASLILVCGDGTVLHRAQERAHAGLKGHGAATPVHQPERFACREVCPLSADHDLTARVDADVGAQIRLQGHLIVEPARLLVLRAQQESSPAADRVAVATDHHAVGRAHAYRCQEVAPRGLQGDGVVFRIDNYLERGFLRIGNHINYLLEEVLEEALVLFVEARLFWTGRGLANRHSPVHGCRDETSMKCPEGDVGVVGPHLLERLPVAHAVAVHGDGTVPLGGDVGAVMAEQGDRVLPGALGHAELFQQALLRARGAQRPIEQRPALAALAGHHVARLGPLDEVPLARAPLQPTSAVSVWVEAVALTLWRARATALARTGRGVHCK
mmetsp:Transcript_4936/g.13042  ORF Transcript_4936/g.13042 Transcript_4936/m.13042 type:complete len:330 (+) Transcript_4936:856-1845(+)